MTGMWFLGFVLAAVVLSVVLALSVWPAVLLGLVAGVTGSLIDETRKGRD